jgi:CHAD domain-containing protein
LKNGEKLGPGIRRIAKREIGAILEHLACQRLEDPGESLHEARKNLKKVRATLRLLRGRLGKRIYRRENRGFREAGRALSPQRDAEVLLKTLEKFRRCHGLGSAKAGLRKLDKTLLGQRRQAFETQSHDKNLEPALKGARRRTRGWPLKKLSWTDLRDGLESSFRRARKARKIASRTRADEDLHEWRKRVKDLWYQLRVVEPLCSKAIAGLAEEMKLLSERLGDDHDLMMLEAAAGNAGLVVREAQVILGWTAARRRELRAAAFELGERLFAEVPARFARRIEAARKYGGHL